MVKLDKAQGDFSLKAQSLAVLLGDFARVLHPLPCPGESELEFSGAGASGGEERH